jgi:transglutaminase-like putative cysteine protease
MKNTPIVLSVSHRTTYRYSTYVETAQHLATIRPISCTWQRVVSCAERIEPEPSYQTSRIDAFGNDVLYFALDTPHERLQLVSETTVALTPRWTDLDPDATPEWEEVAEALRFRVGGQFRHEAEFCFASPNIALRPSLRAYALPSFPPGRPIAAGAIDLMHRIHEDFAYKPSATMFDTPAERAFELKSGVCQDFAQVMIGCLRSLGLPARYVSGYLRNDPPPGQPRLIGADASHAWVSVHCPTSGWIDLDPTNDVLADVPRLQRRVSAARHDSRWRRASRGGGCDGACALTWGEGCQ